MLKPSRKWAITLMFTVVGMLSITLSSRNRKCILCEQTLQEKHVVKFTDNTIRQLKANHTKQTATADRQIKKESPNLYHTTTAAASNWIEMSDQMYLLDETKLRCKAQYMGCFVPFVQLNKLYEEFKMSHVKKHELKDVCMDRCFNSGGRFAGINFILHSCVCSKTIEGFISDRKKNSWASLAWDLAGRCKSPKSYKIYSKIRNCERGVSESAMKEDRIGCLEAPVKLNNGMISLTHSPLTVAQCILNCELRKFTYALPVATRSICLCADSISLFHKVENMQQMTHECSEDGGGNLVPVYRTVIEDEKCSIKFLNLGQGIPILLASYYGSGNTWIRHLIEVSTGVYTGSVYKDMKLYEGGMLGELTLPESGRTIAVKDHLFKLKVRPEFRSAILLLRNPYDATLAEFSRRSTKNHTGVIDPEMYRTIAFQKYAQRKSKYWSDITKTVLKGFSKVLVVYYEDLQQDAVKQMRRVAEFLPSNMVQKEDTFERRLICMNLDLVGKFKRAPRKLDFDPFSAAQRNEYDGAMRDIDNWLLKYHQPPLPDSYFLPS